MTMLLSLALAMLVGLLFTRLAKLVHLPNVTAYLVAGLLIGPSCLGLVPSGVLKSMDIISTVALGFIAFSIGGEFKLSSMKMLGSRVITITFFQAMTAVLMVDAVLLICGFPAAEALTLGAIAAATAPAATLMVVRQYRAKGPLTSTLLPVVAMDDAVGLIVFAISLALARTFANGSALTVKNMLIDPVVEIVLSLTIGGAIGLLLAVGIRFFHSRANRLMLCLTAVLLGIALTVKNMLIDPVVEIVLSLTIGGAIGLLLAVGIRFFHSRANRLMLCLTAVLLGIALAELMSLSSLLLCMMIGAVYCNLGADTAVVMDLCDRWTPPVLLLFFVVSGAELELSVIPTVGLLGIIYMLTRSLGKYFGAYIGSLITHADASIRKYLGITLLPQAGVAIGMAQLVIAQLPQYGAQIRAVVLCATLIYELVGPFLTKKALQAAGEIDPKNA